MGMAPNIKYSHLSKLIRCTTGRWRCPLACYYQQNSGKILVIYQWRFSSSIYLCLTLGWIIGPNACLFLTDLNGLRLFNHIGRFFLRRILYRLISSNLCPMLFCTATIPCVWCRIMRRRGVLWRMTFQQAAEIWIYESDSVTRGECREQTPNTRGELVFAIFTWVSQYSGDQGKARLLIV